MNIVIDTNVLLSSIGRAAPYRWLWDAVMEGRCSMLVCTAILLEYEEIIGRQTNEVVSENILQAITKLPNTRRVIVFFRWNCIAVDPDDNKFVDCALAGNAECIVTNDAHFSVLAETDFPKLRVLSPEELQPIVAGLA